MSWREPWHATESDAERRGLENELARELAAGHPLFGLPVKAVARLFDQDEVLFAIIDGSARVVEVHLTWIQSAPDRPPWPSTDYFANLEDWRRERMPVDHEAHR